MKEQYLIKTVKEAKAISNEFLKTIELENVITYGLPEIDDRYHIWRVPLKSNEKTIGEIVIDAKTSLINEQKTTSKEVLEERMGGRKSEIKAKKNKSNLPKISPLCNTVGMGDSEELLQETPSESVDLVFTSPPYFNARPEYADYIEYEEYLLKMKKIIHQCYRVLNEGRFFVINIAPVLMRRASRNESSKRIAVPFDFHRLFMEEDFEFIDDIIWQKPEGAGWATGRGRRFAADRNPLQYKPVPVTEYVLVYRKKTPRLIDWNIRKHPDEDLVKQSKIEGEYEVTNIWEIHPAHSKKHPAIFPEELATKVIKYYSFINDVVLDPFAGIGTTAKAAYKNQRRFVMYELNQEYIDSFKSDLSSWFVDDYESINWMNPVMFASG
ncbi:DNA-methyltransferase [Dactylococcopsis salina]|uniref:Methyltransferase n=1 Tax=Dactylococcopsis salina (strain PCC 8305) TaxID=13035 RepID=K9YPG6_DACS8|nr:site-specific DNA-methyltransferase [Dactylococcopsis salina]AFZ48836.1 DNA modification methylase [Dactylococcopsis salina PCC 8305]